VETPEKTSTAKKVEQSEKKSSVKIVDTQKSSIEEEVEEDGLRKVLESEAYEEYLNLLNFDKAIGEFDDAQGDDGNNFSALGEACLNNDTATSI